MQAFIYSQTRCVGVCMCIYYNRKQLVMCDIIFQAHGKSMPEPIPTPIHTNIEAPSHSHPGKSSTLSHIRHVGFAHVQTSTNTLSHFSQAVLALTQSMQGILSQLSFLLHVKQTLTPGAIQS